MYDVCYQTIDFNNIKQTGLMIGVRANNEFLARIDTERQVAQREYVKFVRATKATERIM